MSIGSLGGVGSIAGAPMAQRGAETDRVQHESSGQAMKADSQVKAEAAAGIAQPDGQEHTTSERDADGRRLWEQQNPQTGDAVDPDVVGDPASAIASKPSKDASGQSGNQLDLTG